MIGTGGQQVEHLAIGGKIVEVDIEIAPIVAAFNAAGVKTVASCCGHDIAPPCIATADGGYWLKARDEGELEKILALFPLDINGDPK